MSVDTQSTSTPSSAVDPAPGNGHNRGGGLHKLATFILARRRWVIAFWLIMLVVGGAASGSVQQRLSADFSLPGQPGYEVSKQITQQYGNGGDAGNSVVVIKPGDRTIAEAQADIAVAINEVRTQFPQVRILDQASTNNPAFTTSDGKTTYAMLFAPMPETFDAQLISKDIASALQTKLPGSSVVATGVGELQVQEEQADTGVLVETMIAGLGALAVLLYVFASFLALIPLFVAAVAITTTLLIVLGLTYLGEVSFIVLFLVSLVGLGVAIDYSLLVVTRWREELDKGESNADAIKTAMVTAGHAVLLSGLAVAVGLVALIVLPVPSLRSVGYGGMLIPLISVAVVLTLLPALLSGFGRRLNWPRVRKEGNASRMWTAWARIVVKRRWSAAILSSLLLIVMIIPVTDLKIGMSNSESLSKSGPAFDAFKSLREGGVPTGVLTPIEVLTERSAAPQAAQALLDVDGIQSVYFSTAADSNKGNTTVLLAIPAEETVNSATTQPVKDAREAIKDIPGVVGLAGAGAMQLDYIDAVFGNAGLVFGIIAFLTFLLLTRAFHSVVLALKALVLNVISLAAIFGVLTWFWQEGHGSSLFDVSATGSITFWIPTMIFAFLFGLSMDYEVFIIARMREEYDRSGSTTNAIIVGIGRTGRLVTSAALILFMSFASLALSGFTDLKVLATGLGIGILLDATIVRAFLLPALVALFGEWNWWMPAWLAKVLRTEVPPKAIPANAGYGNSADSARAGDPVTLP
jgi:RND superfamily putative drug exporter